jgi:hypothetical protein
MTKHAEATPTPFPFWATGGFIDHPEDAAAAYAAQTLGLSVALDAVAGVYEEHGEDWINHAEGPTFVSLAGPTALLLTMLHQWRTIGDSFVEAVGRWRKDQEERERAARAAAHSPRARACAQAVPLSQASARFADRVGGLFALASLTLEAGDSIVPGARPMTDDVARMVLAIREEWEHLERRIDGLPEGGA